MKYRLSLFLLIGLGCFSFVGVLGQQDDSLTPLLDKVWDFELEESPMLAMNVGDPRGQDRLPDDTLGSLARRYLARKAFLTKLDQIDAQQLTRHRQIDHELLRRRLERQIADYEFKTYAMPISNRSGFHITFPELPRRMNPKSEQDFDNYVSRLNDFGRHTDEQIALLRIGIEEGLTQPSIIMRETLSQVESHIVDDPRASLLFKNVSKESRENLSEKVWNRISTEIVDAIDSSVVPAYSRFVKFLENEYLPACRDQIGAAAMPNGREFYRDRILRFTTLDLTAQEIHTTGINENSRIRGEMEAIRKQVNFEGDLGEFIDHLRTDPKFYAETPEELMKEVAFILKKADGRLPELFGHLPRIPYGLREIPDYVAPQTSSAYYWPPTTDGTRAGFYYLNTYNLSSRPLYQLEALSMHEAVPGHHLQLAIQAELTDLHPMSRQSNITAFIEGWGLYSERLGTEMGFYTDPYQDFGRLSMEAWRASRLVVDTGIHAMGWTRQQAIDYMRENTALSEHNIVAEVDRYIGWPGQALAYKLGELAISKMRKEAESQLGERFDLRSFHDRVLESGSIPLPLLQQRVDEWIAERLTLDR